MSQLHTGNNIQWYILEKQLLVLPCLGEGKKPAASTLKQIKMRVSESVERPWFSFGNESHLFPCCHSYWVFYCVCRR